MLYSFLAGVGSISLLWYTHHHVTTTAKTTITNNNDDKTIYSRPDINKKEENENDENNDNKEQQQQQVEESYDWIEDIKSRIGELPKPFQRSHWPWETIRQHVFRQSQQQQQQQDDNDKTTSSPKNVNKNNGKSSLCIGSIFGLDVGGTLAKLVYFEQKPIENHETVVLPREHHHYHHAPAFVQVARQRQLLQEGETQNNIGNVFSNYNTSSDNDNNNNNDNTKQQQQQRKPLLRRRRSVSLASIARAKVLKKDSTYSLSSDGSTTDDDNGRFFYAMRQESLPDDLGSYDNILQNNPFIHEHDKKNDNNNNNTASSSSPPPLPTRSGTGMKKSRSMFDLSKSRDRAEALDRFYSFARRLDYYREGIKDPKLSFYSRELGGEFHFIQFETRRMQNAMDLICANNLHLNIHEMGATGGGAHKFAKDWEQQLGIRMDRQEELDSLVAGMQFVLSTVVGECYTFRPTNEQERSSCTKSTTTKTKTANDDDLQHKNDSKNDNDDITESNDNNNNDNDNANNQKSQEESKPKTGAGDEWWWSRKVQRDAISYSSTYPYLLVTIGTGVSILRVDGPRKHERISGSTIGGGTYWGLMRLLTDAEEFDDVMKLADRGDPAKIDMMVGDIYGENSDALEKIGLPSNVVASSFGKLVSKDDPASGLTQEDLARALLLMVTNNIGQVAYLNAKLHKTSRIYFVGNFLRRNKISQRRLSWAVSYWSKGEMEALFLEHEGYFGALGAFLLSQNISHSEQGFFQWNRQNNNDEDDDNNNNNNDNNNDTNNGRRNRMGISNSRMNNGTYQRHSSVFP